MEIKGIPGPDWKVIRRPTPVQGSGTAAERESFFAILECELLARRRFAPHAEARMPTFSFIEAWYNPARLHCALGYRSPMTYEKEEQQAITADP